jgi:energy-coupling factor transport system ATP-binding protein
MLIALDHVSLSVAEGEFLAIIGRNGSGKSTLAKHLNALLIPDAGECLVAGMDTRQPEVLWDVRQTVGMVFQNPDNQIVASLVEEDVAFGPENLGVPQPEIVQRVHSALAMVGMSDYSLHAPHLLSGGQKQRVAIAGVLAMKPRCLVLDEPTAMLDPVGRSEVLEAVCNLHRQQGITVILITHFMEEAVAADRVVVMDAGKVIMDGNPAAIFCQVDRIRSLGLDVPIAADIAARLRQKGIALPEGIIKDDELAVALCP